MLEVYEEPIEPDFDMSSLTTEEILELVRVAMDVLQSRIDPAQ